MQDRGVPLLLSQTEVMGFVRRRLEDRPRGRTWGHLDLILLQTVHISMYPSYRTNLNALDSLWHYGAVHKVSMGEDEDLLPPLAGLLSADIIFFLYSAFASSINFAFRSH